MAPKNIVRLVREADIVPEVVLGVSEGIENGLELVALNVAEMVCRITRPTGIHSLPSLTRVYSSRGTFCGASFARKEGQLPMKLALVLCIQWKRWGEPADDRADFQPPGEPM